MENTTEYPPISIDGKKRVALSMTTRASKTPDYRCRTRCTRMMRELARELVRNGKGYILATQNELFASYPEHCKGVKMVKCTNADKKTIWGIDFRHDTLETPQDRFDFIPIHSFR